MADLRALSRFSTSSGLSIDPRLVLDTDRVAAGGMVQSTAATPLSFQTTGANSDITLSATRSITLGATTGAITLNSVISSNFTVSGNVLGAVILTLSATNAVGGGTADVAISCKNTASVAAITFDVNATGAITLDSALSSNLTVTAASPLAQTLTLSCTNGGAGTGNVTVTCKDVLTLSTIGGAPSSIVINSISGLNIDCVQCDLDATGALSIDAATTSNITLGATSGGAQTLTISCTNAGAGAGNLTVSCEDTLTIVSTAPGIIDMDCRQFTLDTSLDISLDTVSSSNFSIIANNGGAQTLTLSCTNAGAGAGNLTVSCEDTLTIVSTAPGIIDMDCRQFTLDTSLDISLDTVSSSNFTVAATSGGAVTLTLRCTNGGAGAGNLTLDCKSTLNIDCADCTLDATAAISLTAATASSFTVSGAAADLTLGARAATITLNQASDTALVGFTATSIIGALNELKLTGGGAAFISTTIPAGASTTDSFASVQDGVAEWLYIIRFNGNIRGGTILASWDQSVPDAKLYETVTTDMGVTTDITFTVVHNGALMRLSAANAGVNVYDFRAVRRVVSF